MKRSRKEAQLDELPGPETKRRKTNNEDLVKYLSGKMNIRIRRAASPQIRMRFNMTIPMGLKMLVVFMRHNSLDSNSKVNLKLSDISKKTGIKESTVTSILSKW